jgi:glutamate-5-semialdehyde dehydrogenase
MNALDSSCIAINASTRFNDGGELGLGAELGISTSKLHAYGPMGAEEMTATRFVVTGHGHVRN